MTKDKKIVGNYKAYFKVDFDKAKDDRIFLNMKASKDVLGLLKEVTIDEFTKFVFADEELQRYKVKSWLFNSLYTSNMSVSKEILFLKDFIDKGNVSIGCESTEQIDALLVDLKRIFRDLITTILKYHNYEIVVNYSVNKEKQDAE